MNKKQLKSFPKLCATKKMMKLAEEKWDSDTLWYNRSRSYDGRYSAFIRCRVIEGILYAAVYLGRELRLGNRKPVYEVYLNKEKKQFLTWDHFHKKWRNSKLNMLEELHYSYYSQVYMSPEDNRMMKDYLGVARNGYDGILEYQRLLREEQLEKRHKKETDAWDKELSLVAPVPKDWEHWVDKHGVPDNYIFYDYTRRKKKEGYCTWCEKTVSIRKPKHNAISRCPRCGHEITYKSRGKAGHFVTNTGIVYLIQKYGEGAILRQFSAVREYRRGGYDKQECCIREKRRIILDRNLNSTVYSYGKYKDGSYRWLKGEAPKHFYFYRFYYYCDYNGRIYPRTLPALEKSILKKTGLSIMSKWKKKLDPEEYIAQTVKYPHLERLVKAGLLELADEVYMNKSNLKIIPSPDLAKSLGIDKFRMRRLKELHGGFMHLSWLRHEKEANRLLRDDLIEYFVRESILPSDLKFILDRMSEAQISVYLKKQNSLSQRKPKELLFTWQDYLFMAGRLQMDLKRELFYKPKDLIFSHNKAVTDSGGTRLIERCDELLEKYPDVNLICQSIGQKYAYEGKEFRIIVPKDVKEIVLEGIALGHCLDKSDIYFDRIQRRESYIVFLRRNKEPQKPFYTLEIEPDGTTRQKRSIGDTQKSDYDEAKLFIKEWQQDIQKHLTGEDRFTAELSAVLRKKEFEELREKQTKIRNGSLAGKLLVDILERDLMLAEDVMRQEKGEGRPEDVSERKAA